MNSSIMISNIKELFRILFYTFYIFYKTYEIKIDFKKVNLFKTNTLEYNLLKKFISEGPNLFTQIFRLCFKINIL